MGIGTWILITVIGTGVLLKYSPTARALGFQCLYMLYGMTSYALFLPIPLFYIENTIIR